MPWLALMSATRLIAPLGVILSSSPWFGLHGVERPAHRDHAVPGPVRLEIVGFRMSNRMRHLISAQIGDQRRGVVPVDPINAVRMVQDAVRASATADQCVKRVADEGDVGDSADQEVRRLRWFRWMRTYRSRSRARRQRPSRSGRRSGLPVYRPGTCWRTRGLFALADCRIAAARAAFRDVQDAVGTELQAARIVEAARVRRDGRARRPADDHRLGNQWRCAGQADNGARREQRALRIWMCGHAVIPSFVRKDCSPSRSVETAADAWHGSSIQLARWRMRPSHARSDVETITRLGGVRYGD